MNSKAQSPRFPPPRLRELSLAIHGRVAEAEGRRRGGSPRRRPAQGGRRVHDSSPPPQSDRVARLHPCLGGRHAAGIHDVSRAVAHEAWTLAEVFGLNEKQVRLPSPFVGGGFGSKLLWQHQILAAAAAKLAGRPVRIMLSREGVFRIVGGRTVTEQRVALGAQADGRLDALIHTGVVAMTPHNNMPEPFVLPAKSVYASKTFFLDVETVKMNMVANTFMRAPGEAVGTFGLESAMDELAVELGMDPIELRIRNEPEKDPLTGLPFSQRGIVQAWRDGAKRFGWDTRSATPATKREGDWLVGMG